MKAPSALKAQRQRTAALLVSVFMIAICGILYELLISTITSYFQGSSVLHFSLVIGLFLSFMGVGSFFSRFIHDDLPVWFVRFELVLSLVGGFSAFLLYFAFSMTPYFYGVAFSLIAVLGAMIGIEIPILTRILNERDSLKDALANVLSFDYLGSLIASVAFPLLLLPVLGTMRTAFAIGFINLAVATVNTWLFREELRRRYYRFLAFEVLLGVALALGFAFSLQINTFYENFLYRDEVIVSEQSKYQKIVVTRWNKDIRLFINGNLQFSTKDEFRYHEPLVHIPMLASPRHDEVLILGGGDGLAAQEILRYDGVQHIDLVDLDPAITDLAREHPVFRRLNGDAMNDPRVTIHNVDAFNYVQEAAKTYNVIIIDLPDPSNESLGKLYSKEFYGLVQRILAADGVMVTQSTSPYFAVDAFWCIHNTVGAVFPTVFPYRAYVPTFGEWGFNMALGEGYRFTDGPTATAALTQQLAERLAASPLTFRYLHPDLVPGLFVFPLDASHRDTPINQLQNQRLIQLYEKNWDQMATE